MALKVKQTRHRRLVRRKPHYTLPQRTERARRRRASMRRFVTGLCSLILLAVVGGAGYTWYMGLEQPVAAEEPAAEIIDRRAQLKPRKLASDAPIGVAMQTYTPDVKAGENASITVKTNPDADCSIVVTIAAQTALMDSGLAAKKADEFGIASWAWTMPVNIPAGKIPVDVTCKNKKNSAVVSQDFIVVK